MIYDQSFNSRTETELTTELSLRKILTRLQLLDASTRELSTGTSDLNPSWQRTSKFGIFFRKITVTITITEMNHYTFLRMRTNRDLAKKKIQHFGILF